MDEFSFKFLYILGDRLGSISLLEILQKILVI